MYVKKLDNQNNMFYIINIKYLFNVIICCDDNILILTYHFIKITLTFLLTYKNVIVTTNILIQHTSKLNIQTILINKNIQVQFNTNYKKSNITIQVIYLYYI